MALTKNRDRMRTGAAINVLDRGAAANGTTDDRTVLAAAASAASASSVLVPAGTYRVASSLTFTVPVVMLPGARFTVDSGQTLTFSGGLTAPDEAWLFTGSGTIAGLTEVRPEWWGAERDGATNDGAAFNKALACVGAAGGGEVRLSTGTYLINTALTVTAANVRLIGQGRGATILSVSSLSLTVITFSGAVQHWEVRGLSIIASVNQTSGAGINCENAAVGRIIDVQIHRCYYGILAGNSVGTLIDHCEVSGFKGTGIHSSGDANDWTISNCIINGAQHGTSTPWTGNVGIGFSNKAEALVVINVEIVLCNHPILLAGGGPTSTTTPAYCQFTNCYFDSCLEGASIDDSRAVTFTGCWFSNRPGDGCNVTNSRDITFQGCTFANSHQHGCTVEDPCARIKFQGCTFDSNGQATANTYAGLIIAAGVDDFLVQGCVASNLGRFTATQGTGIVVEVGNSDRYVIADNLVTGNGVAGVTDGGTGVNKRVANNY